MHAYQREFIDLARAHNVLRFGSFTLKSGRQSPYFFNAGAFATGGALAALGRHYARCIIDSGVEFDGKVVYEDSEVVIPAAAIDETFIDNLGQLIRRVASATPARKVPSAMECGFCNITKADCPERAAGDVMEEGETSDF